MVGQIGKPDPALSSGLFSELVQISVPVILRRKPSFDSAIASVGAPHDDFLAPVNASVAVSFDSTDPEFVETLLFRDAFKERPAYFHRCVTSYSLVEKFLRFIPAPVICNHLRSGRTSSFTKNHTMKIDGRAPTVNLFHCRLRRHK